MGTLAASAQGTPRTPEQDSLLARTRRASQADHRQMLDQLGISELRPGVSNKAQTPNAANYDEAQANAGYPALSVDMQMIVATPSRASRPVPLVLEFAYSLTPVLSTSDNEPTWQQQLLAQGLGLRAAAPHQFSGRQRRGAYRRNYWFDEPGKTPQARRLGYPARLGLGCQPSA